MSCIVARYLKLKRNADFGRVYRRGRYIPGRSVVVHVLPVRFGSEARVGFTVSRRVKGAVKRNRIRRRLREALRTLDVQMAPNIDVVLTAKEHSGDTAFEALKGELSMLLVRAGALAGRP